MHVSNPRKSSSSGLAENVQGKILKYVLRKKGRIRRHPPRK